MPKASVKDSSSHGRRRKEKKVEGIFGGLSTTKIMAIFAIIVACFATLYPRFFHPLLFGSGETKSKQSFDPYDDLPPSARARMGGNEGRERGGGGSPRGPHPGMRYSGGGEGSKRESGGGGGRGGMVSTILPVYAVGIVCYLVYTLFKVFGARKKDKNKRRLGRHAQDSDVSESEQLANISEEKSDAEMEEEEEEDGDGEEDDASKEKVDKSESESEVSEPDSEEEREKARKKKELEKKLNKKKKPSSNELEELLLRADEGDMSVEELHALQKRLADTENQLSRILKTMRTLDNKPTAASLNDDKSADIQEEGDGDDEPAVVPAKSADAEQNSNDSEDEKKKGEKVRRRKGGNKKREKEDQTVPSSKKAVTAGAKDK